jgi:hypothetical protein
MTTSAVAFSSSGPPAGISHVFIQTETVDPECSFIRTSRERVVATGLLTAL